ncbi:MAG: hypothetical protein FJX35_16380 [Alphaproteobacteria bacterium]|nr:hypothetical protein [Alphaproteobacteria bacterium]
MGTERQSTTGEAAHRVDDEILRLRAVVTECEPGHMRRHQALNRIYLLRRQRGEDPPDAIYDCRRVVRRWRIRNELAVNAGLLDYLHSIGFVGDGKDSIRPDERMIINYGDLDHGAPAMVPLVTAIDAAVRAYRRTLDDSLADQLGVSALDRFGLRSFAAATRRAGFHYPHLHGGAILVVSYYVRVPQTADGTAARLYFGFGENKLMDSRTWVVPEEGNIFVFPGHVMHQTSAPGTDEARINVGFDVIAREPA